ncbi:MAG: hypothetical protein ACT4QA_22920 [Panacagrimonas sp.]
MNIFRRCLFASWILLGSGMAVGGEEPLPLTPNQEQGDMPADSRCLRQTGSRIRAEPGKCLPIAGRVITQDELRRSGASNAGEGLRNLLP